MVVYNRSPATDAHVVNQWETGISWLVHPNEQGARTSHAVTADDGIWVIDPLDAPPVDGLLDNLGEVVGVAVLCSHHARDAGKIANRHDVAVHLPHWMDRVAQRVDARIERYDSSFGESGFQITHLEPLSMWQEAIAYRHADETLIIPDLLGAGPGYTVAQERLGFFLSHRLFPPREVFEEMNPERILLGHGGGIFEDANEALGDALNDGSKRFHRAFVTQIGTNIRLLAAGMRD